MDFNRNFFDRDRQFYSKNRNYEKSVIFFTLIIAKRLGLTVRFEKSGGLEKSVFESPRFDCIQTKLLLCSCRFIRVHPCLSGNKKDSDQTSEAGLGF